MYSFTVTPVFLAIGPLAITLIVIAAILVAGTIILAILGRKAQKRQAEQQEQIDAVAQTYTMLIIDKKKMLSEAGLPSSVTENTPWYSKRAKAPVVKAKVGPKVMTFIADPEVFDLIPVHKEVKAKVSGLYISEVKGTHGTHITPPEKKKKSLSSWARKKLRDQQEEKKS